MALNILLAIILLTGSSQMSSASRKQDTTNVKTDIVSEPINEYDNNAISTKETSASCELPSCQGLGRGICTDANYKKFVVENCCITCAAFLNSGMVTTMAIPETTVGTDKAPVVCVDKSTSCAALGLDICTNPLYHKYVVANCAGHCKLCEGGITVPTSVTHKTTSSITASATTAAACVDNIPNCDFYSINDCDSYPQWAKSSCQRYCNLCPKNCEDKIDNCAQFGSSVCTNYKDYAANNCAKYCNLCAGCVDKLSTCRNFDASVCVTPKYAQWAKENCARKCNMCDKGCYYNGTLFEEGAQIQDGCKFVCICHDGNTGRYECTSLCFEYNLPSECTLLPPKPGKCCKTPSCPDNIHLNTTGGNLIG